MGRTVRTETHNLKGMPIAESPRYRSANLHNPDELAVHLCPDAELVTVDAFVMTMQPVYKGNCICPFNWDGSDFSHV